MKAGDMVFYAMGDEMGLSCSVVAALVCKVWWETEDEFLFDLYILENRTLIKDCSVECLHEQNR